MLAKSTTTQAGLPKSKYYASMTLGRVMRASRGYRLFGFIGPTSLPAVALVLGLACRAISVLAPVE
jgi:hypothetical protein